MGEGKGMSTIGAITSLTGLSAGLSVMQGIAGSMAASAQSRAYMQEAKIAQMENNLTIKQKQREIDKTAARQAMAMAKNGIDTEGGSPLEILHETAVLGKEEIDALRRKGQAQVAMYRANASTARAQGRNALLGGIAQGLTTIGKTYINGLEKGLWTAPKNSNGNMGSVNRNIINYPTMEQRISDTVIPVSIFNYALSKNRGGIYSQGTNMYGGLTL